MRLWSVSELIPDSDPSIRAEVKRMLEACDVYEPPTPLDRLLDYRRLTRQEQLDAAPGPIRRLFRKLRTKVMGFLDLRSRVLGVDPALHPARKVFLGHHEVGHDVMPWHRDLFIVTSELDLAPTVRRAFEAEANRFAGHSIFQLEDMARAWKGRRLRVADLPSLAARYGASLTATARQYVMVQDSPCALLVGKPVCNGDGRRGIAFLYGIGTDGFVARFGGTGLGRALVPGHPICACVNLRNANPVDTVIQMTDLRGEQHELLAGTLFNSYNTPTLLHPIRRKRLVLGWTRHLGRAVNF